MDLGRVPNGARFRGVFVVGISQKLKLLVPLGGDERLGGGPVYPI
jgi:hypothetical protein